MEIRQLEHFLAVIDEGTFTRAAERLRLTQPAVSFSIRRLEEDLGGPLFARGLHELSLTEAGRRLADYARKIVSLRDDARREMAQIGSMASGSLTIAAHESAAVYLLPTALRSYVRRFPEIKVSLSRAPLEEIPRQVMDRAVDVGFVREAPSFKELQSVDIFNDEMVCIAPPKHPLAARSPMSLKEVSGQQFVLHHLCGGTNDRIARLFEQHSARCRVGHELWSFENIKEFVRKDIGMAIVPGVTVREELKTGALLRVPIPELVMARRTVMVYRDGGYVSDAAREFISAVRACSWSA